MASGEDTFREELDDLDQKTIIYDDIDPLEECDEIDYEEEIEEFSEDDEE